MRRVSMRGILPAWQRMPQDVYDVTMRPCRRAAAVLALTGALVFAFARAVTQGAAPQTGSIAGRVSDSIGQAVPGAWVTILPQAGGTATRMQTGADGAYRISRLAEGTYRVDFDLLGFDLTRRNHVRVTADSIARADVSLHISAICECVTRVREHDLRERSGQVLDEQGRPLPHARLEIGGRYSEVAYADAQGRFSVRLPAKEEWPLTASDSGFARNRQKVSGSGAAAIVLRLAFASATALPDSERFARGCRCPGDLFTHGGR